MQTQIDKLLSEGKVDDLVFIMCNNHEWMNQMDAAEALVKLHDSRGQKYLHESLKSDNPDIRDIAKEILSGLGEQVDTETANKNELCWFCKQREANPSTTRVVTMVRETVLEKTWKRVKTKTETMKIQIPRCSQCASSSKKFNTMVLVFSIGIVLAGAMSCILLARMNVPDWLPVFSGIAVPVILIGLYGFWIYKKMRKNSPEQMQQFTDQRIKVSEHPAVAPLLKQGWAIQGNATEMEM